MYYEDVVINNSLQQNPVYELQKRIVLSKNSAYGYTLNPPSIPQPGIYVLSLQVNHAVYKYSVCSIFMHIPLILLPCRL